ncbi:hypothetical protein [Streptomyces thermoalcalitolerans]|uniref:Uncharacterized protein n=1 Tax=Streptomyces thermoalcalitolerans TaxID=65605 RepID=A0ABP3ZDC4_9ACTN
MAERVRARKTDDEWSRRLLRIIPMGTWSAMTWRRVQRVLLSAQDKPVAKAAEVPFIGGTGSEM